MKYSLILLFALGLIPKVQAQMDTSSKYREELFSSNKVSIGLKAGFTDANIYGHDLTYIFASNKVSYLPSFHIGIVVNSMIGKYFWLKHELLLNHLGAGVTVYDSVNGKYASTLSTLSVNLFPCSPSFHYKGFQLYAGPYLGMLASAHIMRKDQNGQSYQDYSIYGKGTNFENNSKYLQKIDFGINIGAEYQFPNGVFVGAKYMRGFVQIFQYANTYTFNDYKANIQIFNQAFLVSVGYSFVKKRSKN